MSGSKLYKSLDLKGQCVLITGASAGIGEACAWRFAEAGCRLVLLARRQDRLDKLKQELEKEYQVPIHTAQLDVQDLKAVEQLPSQLPADFAQVDLLINNAGLALGLASVLDNDMQDWRTMIETNVTSVILLTKLFVKGMVDRDRGHIINISSTAGKRAYGGGSMYCATKHAIEAFTAGIREDLLETSVRVSTVSPGAVNTEFSTVRFKGDTARADAVYEGMLPLMAADIADNVIYVATRPLHVQVADILVTSVHQSFTKIARPLQNTANKS